MRIVENFGRRNGKTMELAFQIAEAIKGKGTVAVIPIKELIEYENKVRAEERQKFVNWCQSKGYGCYSWQMLLEQHEKEQKNE